MTMYNESINETEVVADATSATSGLMILERPGLAASEAEPAELRGQLLTIDLSGIIP